MADSFCVYTANLMTSSSESGFSGDLAKFHLHSCPGPASMLLSQPQPALDESIQQQPWDSPRASSSSPGTLEARVRDAESVFLSLFFLPSLSWGLDQAKKENE